EVGGINNLRGGGRCRIEFAHEGIYRAGLTAIVNQAVERRGAQRKIRRSGNSSDKYFACGIECNSRGRIVGAASEESRVDHLRQSAGGGIQLDDKSIQAG